MIGDLLEDLDVSCRSFAVRQLGHNRLAFNPAMITFRRRCAGLDDEDNGRDSSVPEAKRGRVAETGDGVAPLWCVRGRTGRGRFERKSLL
jgi:hypothetical protein